MKRNIKHFILIVSIIIIFLAGCKKHEEVTGDTTPPVISGVRGWEIIDYNDYKVEISWITDEPATSQVEYGTTDQYGSETVEDLNLVLDHKVIIENLTPGVSYRFKVKSKDADNNLSTFSNSFPWRL